jgi:hypothetical protein
VTPSDNTRSSIGRLDDLRLDYTGIMTLMRSLGLIKDAFPRAICKMAGVPTAVAKMAGVPTAVAKMAGVPTAVAKMAGVPTAVRLWNPITLPWNCLKARVLLTVHAHNAHTVART